MQRAESAWRVQLWKSEIENWKIETKEGASRSQRLCDDERGIRRV
jgi:hypothetical protein